MVDVVETTGDQIIYRGYLMAVPEKAVAKMRSDKPCSACNQDTQ
jgi:hypothetical protein